MINAFRAVFGLVLLTAVPLAADYLLQGDPRAGGMRDVMLIYHREGMHRVEHLLPYVAYLDKAQGGRPVDWFYDSFLFMAYGGAPSGQLYITGATDRADWQFWLDVLFEEGRNLSALEATIERVARTLGPPPQKTPIIIMIPYPSPEQTDFGDVDGDGKSESFASDEERLKAIQWVVDEAVGRFKAAQFKHLSLWGFYWMNEGVAGKDEALVKQTAGLLHERELGFHWIPWFRAPGFDRWQELGFDFVVLQPNYAFMRNVRPDEQRLTDCGNLAREHGLGVEIELNPAILTTEAYRENLRGYLTHGTAQHDGYMAAVHGYYQGGDTIRKLYESDLPANNQLYRDLYLFAKGRYQAANRGLAAGLPATLDGRPMPQLTDGLTITDESRLQRGVRIAETADVQLALPRRCDIGEVRVHVAFPAEEPVLRRLEVRDGERLLAAGHDLPASRAGGLRLGWLCLPVNADVGGLTCRLVLDPGGVLYVDEVALGLAREPTWGLPYELPTPPTIVPAKATGTELTDGLISLAVDARDRGIGWDGGEARIELALPNAAFLGDVTLYAATGDPLPALRVGGAVLLDGETAFDLAEADAELDEDRLRWRARVGGRLGDALRVDLSWPEGERLVLEELTVGSPGNLALGKPYQLEPAFPAQYPDDGGELTDGDVSAGFGDGRTVGWIQAAPAVTVDLGAPKSVDGMRVHLQGGGSAWVHFPREWAISVSPDGRQWDRMHSADGPAASDTEEARMEWWEAKFDPASARFVRLRFEPRGWIMLSEIEVLGGGRNLARGRPYSLQPAPTSTDKYADRDARLTDGRLSARSWSEGRTAGWHDEQVTITVDLLQPTEVRTLAVHLAGGGPAAVWFPEEVTFHTSLDGESWSAPVTTRDHPPESGDESIVGYMHVKLPPTRVRFVRAVLTAHGWVMPDEIEVFPPH